MRFFSAALFFLGAVSSFAQAPEVPHKMQFAGMTLTIRDDARREIQKDVDALTMHGRYYTLKAERAKTYFPIIEKIFEEEHLPDDFKYLVLQESALVPDAVSVSNAVGFWQFKDYTAMSMGMRVDRQIDERMNLISATRGAAKYLKQNNYLFNNWIYALQSYQMGAGGVQRSVGDVQNGARHMEINSDTYWYVKKFLAHKVAFGDIQGGEAQIKVMPYQATSAKSLKQIAEEMSSTEQVLKDYNKWLKTDMIPMDKPYVVLIPVGKLDGDFNKLVLASSKASKAAPLIAGSGTGPAMKEVSVNGISTIRARSGETVSVLAARAQISLTSFLKYNDIKIDHAIEPGAVYLLAKKKNKASEDYYKTKPGDNLWSVSQQFGVKIKRLMKYNRMSEEDMLAAGTTIWLSSMKSETKVIELEPDEDVVKLSENETFDWYLKTTSPPETSPFVKEGTSTQIPAKVGISPDPKINTIAVETLDVSTHTVKKGDTFTSIAKQYGVQITDLLTWNDINVQDPLKLGQVLRVKMPEGEIKAQEPPDATSSQTLTHTVKASDTLYSIARQYGVTIRDIMEWNDKKDFTLTLGEKLRIIQK